MSGTQKQVNLQQGQLVHAAKKKIAGTNRIGFFRAPQCTHNTHTRTQRRRNIGARHPIESRDCLGETVKSVKVVIRQGCCDQGAMCTGATCMISWPRSQRNAQKRQRRESQWKQAQQHHDTRLRRFVAQTAVDCAHIDEMQAEIASLGHRRVNEPIQHVFA